ncbi:MAG: GLPGLI family protein [Bacteroidetes bacterium]|nr:GLPGLI family protein [Bacteroidota bacterium]MCY4204510.1 GLPGLI family protein [Bacteroidota bacterium]
MRQIILIAVTLVPFSASAQMGTVRYTHTYPVLYSHYFDYSAARSELVGTEFVKPPMYATVSRSMVFDTTASLMYPTDKPHVEPEDRKVSEGEEEVDTTYVNFRLRTYTESRVLGMDVYLANDEIPSIPWRLGDEERVYLGLRVEKATAVIDSTEIEAWFTSEIPIPAGPGLFGGLPGLILMVTNAASGEVYAADSLLMDELVHAIVPPVRGLEVSDGEYIRTRKEVMDEDRRLYEQELRDIQEGKITILKWRGQ